MNCTPHYTDEPQIEIREEPAPKRVVNINFQKNSNRKLKYLEAEPKLLGTTQIVLAFFHIFYVVAMYASNITWLHSPVTAAFSVITIIAGSLGLAAQNLHLPTIKACFGMQVVAGVSSVLSVIMHFENIFPFYCDEEKPSGTVCENIYQSYEHLLGMQKLVVAVQVGLSATLAAYCCKVIECCSPSSSVTVISVDSPADAQ